MRNTIGVLGLLVGLAAANAAEPEIKIARNYSEEYNATIRALPEADLAKFELAKAWKSTVAWKGDRERTPGRGRATPGTPEWDQLVAWVGANSEVLGHLRAAGDKKASGWLMQNAREPVLRDVLGDDGVTLDPNPFLIEVVLPHLGELRTSSWLLAADAQLALHHRDVSRWLADLHALAGLGLQACGEPTFIQKVVGHAVISKVFTAVGYAIESRSDVIDDAGWKRIDELLARVSADARVRLADDGERWIMADIIQRIYTDDGHGDGRVTKEGWKILMGLFRDTIKPGDDDERDVELQFQLLASQFASRKEETELIAKREPILRAWASTRIGAIDGTAFRAWEDEASRVKFKHIVASILSGDLIRMYTMTEQTRQNADGLRLAIAAERYRRAKGTLPQAATDLAADLLKEIPLDRWSGKAVLYKVRDGAFVVYSVGCDLDDDDGTPLDGEALRPDIDWWAVEPSKRPSGDYVIFSAVAP